PRGHEREDERGRTVCDLHQLQPPNYRAPASSADPLPLPCDWSRTEKARSSCVLNGWMQIKMQLKGKRGDGGGGVCWWGRRVRVGVGVVLMVVGSHRAEDQEP